MFFFSYGRVYYVGLGEHELEGQDRAGQDWTGMDRTGQDGTGQDRTGQDRMDQIIGIEDSFRILS